MMLRDLHPSVRQDGWRAVIGVVGDLGANAVKWGDPPWPAELGRALKECVSTK